MPHLRRAVIVSLGLSAATALILACGAFSEDTSGTPDGGAEASVGDESAPAPPCDPGKVASDPFHCGVCDHSCLGGACENGACKPVLVARTSEPVNDVAVDAQRILWMTVVSAPANGGSGHLYACLKSGCSGMPSSLAMEGVSTGSLAGDGVSAYASFVYGFKSVAKITPMGMLQELAEPSKHSISVRLDVRGDLLHYFSQYETPSMDSGLEGGQTASVYEWNGASERRLGGFEHFNANIQNMSVVGSRLVFTSPNTIFAADVGVDPAVLVADAKFPISSTTDGKRFFWVADGTKQILACDPAVSCTSPATVAGPSVLGTKGALSVSYSRGRLYIATRAGELLECDADDCGTTKRVVATEPALVFESYYFTGHTVTADDAAIYWSALDDPSGTVPGGRIMKLAK